MKILTLTHLFPNSSYPNYGVFVKERMRYVSKLCEVKVVAPVRWVPRFLLISKNERITKLINIPKKEIIDGLEVYHPRYFTFPFILRFLDPYLIYLSILPFLKRLKKEYDFDLIDTHFGYPDGVYASFIHKYFNIKTIVTAHRGDLLEISKARFKRMQIKRMLKEVNFLITVSDEIKDKAIELGCPKNKILTVGNGIDIKKFILVKSPDLRKELGLPEGKKIILCVGSIIERKGFHLVVDAIKNEKDKILIIIGNKNSTSGSNYDSIAKMIKKYQISNVIIPGEVMHDKLYKYFNAADIFCLPSSSEGSPDVILESIACSTPFVATPVGDIPSILKGFDCGIVVERNVDSVRDGLQKALNKQWDREGIADYGKSFSWEEVAKKVVSVFEKALA